MPALADDLAAWDELELALEELEAHGELEAYLVDRPPANRAVLERLQAERGCGWRGHPAAMAAHLTDDIKQWRYVRLLSRKFREAADGVSKRQIWNLPARYGKSTIASQWGPAWLLDRNPFVVALGLSLSGLYQLDVGGAILRSVDQAQIKRAAGNGAHRNLPT